MGSCLRTIIAVLLLLISVIISIISFSNGKTIIGVTSIGAGILITKYIFTSSSTTVSEKKAKRGFKNRQKSKKNKDHDKKALNFYKQGEKARKNREVQTAYKYLKKSCDEWIKYSKSTNLSPAPAPFRKLAKLYYHTNKDQKAIECINKYLKHSKGTKSGNLIEKRTEMKNLRDRLKKGDFRRQPGMYE